MMQRCSRVVAAFHGHTDIAGALRAISLGHHRKYLLMMRLLLRCLTAMAHADS